MGILGGVASLVLMVGSESETDLRALRIRMVTELSVGMDVRGPYFVVKHRGLPLHDGDYFR